MRSPTLVFHRRLAALFALLILAVTACLALAFLAARDANRSLSRMADVEQEAALLARHFRAAVEDLHGALLRVGTDSADDTATVIQQRRQRLSDWLAARQAAARSSEERQILQQLSTEVSSYFLKLDSVAARTDGFANPVDRDTIVMLDDSANRLQSMADDFAAVHDAELRDLLAASLAAVRWMRNLVFLCLAVLIMAIAVVVALLYRDVVRPLRAQLFKSKALLSQREKLAALGTLAAGVAHEIRNPLTAVKARLYTLRRGVTAPSAQEDVRAIAQEIDRLERIVRDVLGYARPAEPKFNDVELSGWLRDLAAFLSQDLAASQITLTVEAAAPVVARIDSDQLRQVVLNLVRNAQEAFAGQPGGITLALHRERSVLQGRPSDVAVIAVTDNGPGIPAEHQARLFDPFFTTKASGTGLGLSIVARLIEQHGGEITFQSAPRTGTRFAVRLPLDQTARNTQPE
jgi:signal transduction histidine kinase